MAEGHVCGTFFFDGSDPLYKDHFPGNPVVPGSLVVEAFVSLMRDKSFTVTEVVNFRFRRFVPPGKYPYEILITGLSARCTLFSDEKKAVTGELVIS